MKRYLVRLTRQVEADLLDLFEYIAKKDSVANNHVVVLGCFDGRRDMQTLLERRLLR
ncbi:hypothetical protein ACFL3I_00895 [Pseudomonadota bacterium]